MSELEKLTMPRGLEKISTPRGEGRSMTPLSPYQMNVSTGYGGTGNGKDWFGPLTPLNPIAPPEVAGRTWDFVPGYNLNTTPRPYEAVDFATLRALANAYDPLRLVIERRKDQMVRLPWTIRVKHDGKKRPAKSALSESTQRRIEDVQHFFRRPTYDYSFRQWLRVLLEDLFVIDAPSLFCERNYGGDLIGLSVLDGGTIKRVISDWGTTPRPIAWRGDPFDWNGQIITADNFTSFGFKLDGGMLWPPAFQQILKGMPAVDLTARDLIYKPNNPRSDRVYGFSPVEQVLTTVNTAMRRAHHQLDYYREGNQPEALFSLPESWTPDNVANFQDYWDNVFRGNLGNRRTMKFLAGGSKSSYIPLKEPPLKSEFDEWLVRIVCAAFSYPPTAFVALSNRSVAEQHEMTGEEEGLEPTKQWAAELFSDIIADEFNSPDLEFAWVEEDDVDQETQATILRGYVEDGILSINEARDRLGEEPDPSPEASALMVKTATGLVPIAASNTNEKDQINAE